MCTAVCVCVRACLCVRTCVYVCMHACKTYIEYWLKHILNTDYIDTLHLRGIHSNGAEKIYRGAFQNN